MLYIIGEYLNFRDGILLWSACNGATRRVLKLLRAPNIADDQFIQCKISGCDTPVYQLKQGTIHWIDTSRKETSVFIIGTKTPEPKAVYVVLNADQGFGVIAHPSNSSPVHLHRTSSGSRACSAIAVVSAPAFVERYRYDGSPKDYFCLAEDAPHYLGSRNAVIAKAFADDNVCRQLMQQAGWDIGTL